MKFKLKDANNKMLDDYFVNAKDRDYQFLERNSLSIDLWNEPAFIQQLNYIHYNPVKHPWYLSATPETYKYSSAKFYETGIDDFGFLTHFKG